MGIHTPKRDTGMENEITHQKRCGIGERGKEGPCDSLTEIDSITHMAIYIYMYLYISNIHSIWMEIQGK